MQLTGEFRLAAPREEIWRALNDPAILKQCLPGCQSLEKTSDTDMVATVKSKIGPVSATFQGKVTLSDLDPPNGYKITGEGSGGAAGFAKGEAVVRLASDGDQATVLSYTAKAQIGGKLAQIGARLIDATAKQMADAFFSKFAEIVGTAPALASATADELGNESGNAVLEPAAGKRNEALPKSRAPLFWTSVAVVAAIVALALFALYGTGS